MNITIVGTYVGLNTGAMLAYLGHRVARIDIDEERLTTLRRGHLGTRSLGRANITGSSQVSPLDWYTASPP